MEEDEERFVQNGKRGSSSERESASRVAAESHGKRGRTRGTGELLRKARNEDAGSLEPTTVYIYFHSAKRKEKERDGEGMETRRSEASKTILVHISYWCIIGGKERRRAKRHSTRIEGKSGTSTRVE